MGMYGWHDNSLIAYDLTVDGTLTFGDAATDNLIIKGRVSSMTVAGSTIGITSSYTHGEGIEMRYAVTGFSGSSFKGMYLRAEAATNAATDKSIYGAELYGVCNNVTMGTGSLWGTLTYAYVKGASAVTINHMYAVQGELSWDASRTGACTITTAAACFRAKITGGYVADYTKIDGYVLTIGEMDGDSQTFGNGLLMQDDADMTGTSTLTTGLNINIGCTTGISIAGACSSRGIRLSADCQIGIQIEDQSVYGLYISGTTTDAVLISGDAAANSINITGDSTNAISIAGATTYAITISGTPATADIMLHNGATIMNGSAGVLTITETDISLAGTVAISGKMQFGGATDWGTGATGILVDGTGYDWASQTIARVNSDLNATAAAAAYHAMTVTASQTTTNSIFGTWTELYIAASVVLTGSSNYAAVWGNLEVATGCTSTDSADFMAGVASSITTVTGFVNNCDFCGVRSDSNVHATHSGTGKFYAFKATIVSGSDPWDYGLSIGDGVSDIGIAIGTTTTNGITLGTTATGISLSSATTVGLLMSASLMGLDLTSTLPAGAAANANEINVTDNSTGSSGYARALWINATVAGDKTIAGEHNGIGIDQTVSGNTPYLYGLTYWSQDSGDPTIGFAAPISVYQDDLGTNLGAYVCIDLGIALSNAPTDRYHYMRFRDHSTAIPTSVFRFEGGHCASYLFDTTGGTGTPDFITANAGQTPAADGILIAINYHGTPYYIKAASAWS